MPGNRVTSKAHQAGRHSPFPSLTGGWARRLPAMIRHDYSWRISCRADIFASSKKAGSVWVGPSPSDRKLYFTGGIASPVIPRRSRHARAAGSSVRVSCRYACGWTREYEDRL